MNSARTMHKPHGLCAWFLACLLALMSVVGLLTLDARAASSPTLIPFQGRLTNPQGVPYNTGQYTISFTLYDQAVGGTVLWTETHVKVGVINGMVNVFLGSIVRFDNPGQGRPPVTFAENRHLGITIDADNNPNTSDPEMIPRQMIIPAFWAKHAEDSTKLSGRDLGSVADYVLPRGIIVLWSGTAGNIPTGWALCDGAQGTPNLRGRFVVGLDPGDADYNAPNKTGGAKEVTLTTNQIPAHAHSAAGTTTSDGNHQHAFVDTHLIVQSSVWTIAASSQNIYNIIDEPRTTAAAGQHSHSLNITVGSSGGGQAHENRPPFYVLAYIMKL